MRLSQYITESPDDKLKMIVQRECSKMIKIYEMYINKPLFFWRGVGTRSMVTPVKKKKPHLKDRKPMSTGKGAHDWLNDYFKEKFGWPVRNGISTSGNWAMAEGYGYPHIFLPTNDFKFVYSDEITDLWNSLPSQFAQVKGPVDKWLNDPDAAEGWKAGRLRLIDDYVLPKLGTYTDYGIRGALGSGREVMFNCKHYYLVDPNNHQIVLNQTLTGSPWDWSTGRPPG